MDPSEAGELFFGLQKYELHFLKWVIALSKECISSEANSGSFIIFLRSWSIISKLTEMCLLVDLLLCLLWAGCVVICPVLFLI